MDFERFTSAVQEETFRPLTQIFVLKFNFCPQFLNNKGFLGSEEEEGEEGTTSKVLVFIHLREDKDIFQTLRAFSRLETWKELL